MKKSKLYVVTFILALTVQLVILAAVPAKKILPKIVGRTVLLAIRPVDPYDLFSGYYMTLRYEISQPTNAENYHQFRYKKDESVYVVLAEADTGLWQAVSIHDKWPDSAPKDAIVIKGQIRRGWIRFGIERFYVPETLRHAMEKDLRSNIAYARAEVAVGPFGNAVILRLRVQDRTYE